MKIIQCLECENDIELDDKEYRVGDVIECSFCGTELEVIDLEESGRLVLDVVEEEK